MAGSQMFFNDGAYQNLVTGLGNVSMDKDEHPRVQYSTVRPDYDALAMQFVRDGVVKRLCKEPVDKALKTPIVINGDENDKHLKELTRLGFFNAVRKAGMWTRLFGGSIVVTLYEGDGSDDLSKPASRSPSSSATWFPDSPARTKVTFASTTIWWNSGAWTVSTNPCAL